MNIQRYVGIDNGHPKTSSGMIKVALLTDKDKKEIIYPLTYFFEKSITAQEDWLKNQFVLKFRPALAKDKLSLVREHQIMHEMNRIFIPETFDGLRSKDCIGVIFDGGHQDFLVNLLEIAKEENIIVMGLSQKKLEKLSKRKEFKSKEKAEIIRLLLKEDIRHFDALEI